MQAVSWHPSASSDSAASQEADLAELRAESTRLVTLGVTAAALVVLAYGALIRDQIRPELLGLTVSLLGVAGSAAVLHARHAEMAGAVLCAGIIGALCFGFATMSAALLAPWFGLVVFIAGAIFGWRGAVLPALAVTATIAYGALRMPPLLSANEAWSAIALAWASLITSWLMSRPTTVALSWAWHSYLEAVAQTQRARERQTELARLAKTAAESNYHLKQLNLELDRARAAAQEARRLKSQFATAVSHELRTPLNLIIGFCEMMVLAPSTAYGQKLPPSYRGDLEAIYRNACHISALVDDILDLSQIDADRMALHRDWTSLAETIAEAIATVETLFFERGLYLRTDLPDDLPSLFIDRTRIRQILINLLANAARCIQQGGVVVRAHRESEAVVVAVADTGPGIPAAELHAVFEEFRQVSGAPWQRGSGLGLTVSRLFAELHGGALLVESVLGEGSTFYVKLPSAAVSPLAPWREQAVRAARRQERRVLVVDDAGQVQRLFARYLDGMQVLSAPNLEKARRLIKREVVHALILGSGAQAAWSATAKTPEFERLPVICCPLHTPRCAAEDLGVVDYLVKPVTREQVRVALRRTGAPVRDVLIVDDDEEMLRLLRRMVRSIVGRCHIRTASNGTLALELLLAQRPDVLLLDLLMDAPNGYTVLQHLRGEPSLNDLPVIIVTARGSAEEAIVAGELRLSRAGGLAVSEVMRWISSGLDALLATPGSAPAPPAAPPG